MVQRRLFSFGKSAVSISDPVTIMSQQDNSVHQALAHLDRVNQFITTLRQLGDNDVAIAAVCRDELAHLSNTLTPTLLVRTVNRYRGVVEARLGKGHPALSYFDKGNEE